MVGGFREECGDEAEEGGFVWKDAGDAGAAFEFLVDAFEGVAGAQAALVGGWEGEDGEAFGMAVSSHAESFGAETE